jgi:photosystem II stability/assembly factor-like uncharacterized protein
MTHVNRMAISIACLSVFIAASRLPASSSPTPAPSPSPTPAGPFASIDFRTIGPDYGRIDAVAGVAGNPKIYFAGGLGGLLRSRDGGATWRQVFTDKPVSSIGAVAVAASNPNIVYVGTGEPNLRSDIAFGDGVWRSDDGGDTWRHVGLASTSQIATVAVDPTDPNTVFVAAVVDPYKSGSDGGVYKTGDGGKTWRRVLAGGNGVGASSVVIQPGNPHVLVAGLWSASRSPYMLTSGGPGGGLFSSSDDGEHWTQLSGHGLPDGVTGRIGLAFAPNAPSRLYALIESRSGVLWRSDDAGATWKMVSDDHNLAQRPFYFSELSVDPRDKDHLFFLSVRLMESKDGGATANRLRPPGGDNHQMWIDPTDGDRLIVGDDGGLMYSLTGGKTWSAPPILVSQSYHVSVDDRVPYTVCSEDQDTGAYCGPSNDLVNGDIEPIDWIPPGGGECGWIVFDGKDDNFIYGSGYEGTLTRYDRRTNQAATISPWPDDTSGWGAGSLRYRFQWTAPVATAPWNPSVLYFGGNRLFATTDRGRTWQIVSPDLTRNVKAWQQHAGGPITGDNTGPEEYDTIFSIAASPRQKGLLWVGTDDGLAWITFDSGAHWKQVTPAGVGMPVYGRIDYIEPSPFDAATAYMAVEDHERGDRAPYLFATSDYGHTWRGITGNLPRTSYTRVIKEDRVRRGLLYVGTETGLWFSLDNGGSWQQFHDNFPTVPVYDFALQQRFDDLVVATHGRSNMIFDDLRPLQEYSQAVTATAAHLFSLRPAYRFAGGGGGQTNEGSGDDPQYGVDVNFYLKKAQAKKDKIKVEVLEGTRVIRTIGVSDAVEGVNRTWWDLRYDGIDKVPRAAVEGFAGFTGPLAVPGTYSIRLVAAGTTLTRTVDVLPDPRANTPLTDLRAQLSFLLRIRDDESQIGARILKLRAAKSKADKTISGPNASAAAVSAVHTYDQAIGAALNALYQPADLAGEDDIRDPIHVYEKLNSLAGFVSGADVAPRPADVEELNTLEAEMRAGLAKADAVLAAGIRQNAGAGAGTRRRLRV